MRYQRHKEEISKRSRSRILKAASKLFVDKGFAGTSLGDVAKKIDVNQSLIYHYFASKEELWKTVKEELLQGYLEASQSSFDVDEGLRPFLQSYLSTGFDYFRRRPDVVRILSWQSLEGDQSKLAALEMSDQERLMKTVARLKEQGQIRSDMDPFVVILMIRNALRAPFFDDYAAFEKDAEVGQKYVDLVVDCLTKAFKG